MAAFREVLCYGIYTLVAGRCNLQEIELAKKLQKLKQLVIRQTELNLLLGADKIDDAIVDVESEKTPTAANDEASYERSI